MFIDLAKNYPEIQEVLMEEWMKFIRDYPSLPIEITAAIYRKGFEAAIQRLIIDEITAKTEFDNLMERMK